MGQDDHLLMGYDDEGDHLAPSGRTFKYTLGIETIIAILSVNLNVRYKPRVPGKPCTSHKNVGFLNLNAQQIHTAQKNKKLYCQGRARRKAPVFYCGF